MRKQKLTPGQLAWRWCRLALPLMAAVIWVMVQLLSAPVNVD